MAKNLFKPIKVGDFELEHRVVMAPLTRYRAPGHIPSEMMVEYYRQRAQRPGTLIVTEATFIHPKAGGFSDAPGVWSDEQVTKWKPVISAIHEKHSRVFMQLWALGRVADPTVAKKEGIEIVGASPVPLDESSPTPRALSRDELNEYLKWYAQAAKNAIAAGADGVEIHSANGYLLDQFLHINTNQRDDEYGGSIEGRALFPLEVVRAVIDAVGAHKVAIRLSPWGIFGNLEYDVTPIPQYGYLLGELEKLRSQGKALAYVHVVEPRAVWRQDSTEPLEYELNNFIGKIWKGPLVRCGSLGQNAVQFAEENVNTLVAIGRHFISNPDIVDRLENGVPLAHYDRPTFYRADPSRDPREGYIDYPIHY